MNKISRFLSLIIGSLIVALSFNLFIMPNNLLSFGVNGLAGLINLKTSITPAINIIIIDMIIILISSLIVNKKTVQTYLLPSILIALFIYLTKDVNKLIVLNIDEMMLAVLAAGFMSGLGYSFIYKQGYSAGTIYILEEVINKLTHFHTKIYTWFFDIIILILSVPILGYQTVLYSLVVIIITKYMITKARFGISDSKMFYIITSKEKEMKNFIMHDLKYELTVLDVKGGFSKKKNQILLTVIGTEDYYRLKEGIKIIDPQAFIAITDTYDVINRRSF